MPAPLHLVRSIDPPSATTSSSSSAMSSLAHSKRFQMRMLTIVNKAQVLMLRNPRKAVFLMNIVENFLDRALRDC